MDRKAVAAIAALAILSVAVLLGSVLTALASFADQEVHYSALDVPEGLLSPEPIDAVRHKPTTAELAAELDQSPIPSPSPTPKRIVQRSSPSPAQSKVTRFEISMVSIARGKGRNRTIGYEITVRNVGEVAVGGLVVRSHVPSGTAWAASPQCDHSGHLLTISYPDSQEALCVEGAQTIRGDMNAHPVEATLNSFAPGTSVVVSFTVDVDSAPTDTIVNHAHLSGIGIEMQSASTSDSASATQEST